MAVLVPKFKVPFQIVGSKALTIEQDSPEEVAQCVEAIVATPLGDYELDPDLGIPDYTFTAESEAFEEVRAAVDTYEERAETTLEAGTIENMTRNILLSVSAPTDPEEL